LGSGPLGFRCAEEPGSARGACRVRQRAGSGGGAIVAMQPRSPSGSGHGGINGILPHDMVDCGPAEEAVSER